MFERTRDENGACATRCLFCFRTLAAGLETESELDPIEARHLCPQRVLAQERARQQAAAPQKATEPEVRAISTSIG